MSNTGDMPTWSTCGDILGLTPSNFTNGIDGRTERKADMPCRGALHHYRPAAGPVTRLIVVLPSQKRSFLSDTQELTNKGRLHANDDHSSVTRGGVISVICKTHWLGLYHPGGEKWAPNTLETTSYVIRLASRTNPAKPTALPPNAHRYDAA